MDDVEHDYVVHVMEDYNVQRHLFDWKNDNLVVMVMHVDFLYSVQRVELIEVWFEHERHEYEHTSQEEHHCQDSSMMGYDRMVLRVLRLYQLPMWNEQREHSTRIARIGMMDSIPNEEQNHFGDDHDEDENGHRNEIVVKMVDYCSIMTRNDCC